MSRIRECPRHDAAGNLKDAQRTCNRGHCGDGGVVYDGTAAPSIDAIPLRREVEVALGWVNRLITSADPHGQVVLDASPIRASLGRILDKLDRDIERDATERRGMQRVKKALGVIETFDSLDVYQVVETVVRNAKQNAQRPDLGDSNDVATVRTAIGEAVELAEHWHAQGLRCFVDTRGVSWNSGTEQQRAAAISLDQLRAWFALLGRSDVPATTGEAAQQHDVKRGPYRSTPDGGESWSIECICGQLFHNPYHLGAERCIAAFAEQHAGHAVKFEVGGPISLALPPEYGDDGLAPRCEAHGIGLCSWCMNGQARVEDEPPRRGRLGEICDLLDDIANGRGATSGTTASARVQEIARLVSEALSDQLVEVRK